MSTIKIKETNIDLATLNLGFEALNNQQLEALNRLADFLDDDKAYSTVLSGSAGTGKSSIVRILMEYIKTNEPAVNIQLSTPTHKAKCVLNRLSNTDTATTLHKILGLKPDMNLTKFDVRDLTFYSSLLLDLFPGKRTIYVIDECSMINDHLFRLIVDKLGVGKDKIIFIGDGAQLSPVNQNTISMCFTGVDFPGMILTEVMRQLDDNPLLKTLVYSREHLIKDFKSDFNDTSGIVVHNEIKDFAKAMHKDMVSTNYAREPFKQKVLAYTNKRVNQLNKFIRDKIFKHDAPICKGDLLMGNDTYTLRDGQNPVVYNGSDYVVVQISKIKKNIPMCGDIDGYKLSLYDTVDKYIFEVFVIDPEISEVVYTRLANMQESVRLSAIDRNVKGFQRKRLWNTFYSMIRAYSLFRPLMYQGRMIRTPTFVYGYAITVHKSQGSTYDNVFVDMSDINACFDKKTRRELQYVALSRARNYAHLLTNE